MRGRVVVSQLPQTLTTVLIYLSMAVFHAPLLAHPLVQWAGVLTVVLTVVCAAVPWDRLPYRSFLVVPVLDFVPIGLLFEGVFPQMLGVPLLAAFPVLWLVASAQLPRTAAPLGALLTLAMLWTPLVFRPGPVTIPAVTGPLLIPVMMLAIGLMAQVLTNSMEAKDAQLRQLLAAGARRERLLDTVLDAVDVGVLAIDRHGHDILMNRRQRRIRLLGVPAGLEDAPEAELLVFGPNGDHPLPPDQRPVSRAVAGEAFSNQLIRIGPPPAQRVLSVSTRVMTDEHFIREGTVLSFHDVTDLVEALRAQDEFVAGISHELRTPLTSIRGYTELLAMDEHLPAHVHAGLEVIERNTEQLLNLVTDLLDTHRTTVGIHRVRLDLVPLLEQSTAAAQPHAAQAGITVKTSAPESLLVDGDPVRISQVLDNLFSNAIKYSPTGSTVFVVATSTGQGAQIQVIDHGPGMDPADTTKVFDRFYRSPTARMSTIPGLGIGLALSKDIIDQHGGTITCHSTPGEGTVFTITLPATPPTGPDPLTGNPPHNAPSSPETATSDT
ncbi:two-component sensor histidine kinase [Kocuria dechangensis]|uniref:Sensor-like histidine kinase SenX3 n=1 Tax=Kocuria dechangensis TaxID=1176249 RepID=A0A917LVG4_9MICC|nr:two-component sensor histidine kinase [Kocuria dechangensis]